MSENIDKIISTNNQLKEQLNEIKGLIENSFENDMQVHYTNNPRQETERDNFREGKAFQETVANYNKIISEIRDKISLGHDCIKLQEQENQLKSFKLMLEVIEKENKSLKIVKRRQDKGISEINNKYNNNVERVVLNERHKNIKEECKILKEFNENQVLTIKKQHKEILALTAHCDLIKANINRKRQLGELNEEEKPPNFVYALEEKAYQEQSNAKNEMLYYITQTRNQKDKCLRLDQEISIIKANIKQKDQEIRINQLKYKELKRLENKTMALHSQHSQSNILTKNLSTIKSYANISIGPKLRQNSQNSNSLKSISFKKYMLIKRDYTYPEEKKKTKVYHDIENLKNDIQKVLHQNHSEYSIFNKRKREELSTEKKKMHLIQLDNHRHLKTGEIDNKKEEEDVNKEKNKMPTTLHSNNKQASIKSNNISVDNDINPQNNEECNEDEIAEVIDNNKGYDLQMDKPHENVYIIGNMKNRRKPFGDFGFPKEDIKNGSV